MPAVVMPVPVPAVVSVSAVARAIVIVPSVVSVPAVARVIVIVIVIVCVRLFVRRAVPIGMRRALARTNVDRSHPSTLELIPTGCC